MRFISVVRVSMPNWKRPLSNSRAPSSRASFISVSCSKDQMRSICEPSWLTGEIGILVPFVFATASAIGKNVRAMIGRPLLNWNF